jgi:hypothetical protein
LVLKHGQERLVLLFNEGEAELPVTLRNIDLAAGQQARVFERGDWGEAGSVKVVIPPRDAVVVHVR